VSTFAIGVLLDRGEYKNRAYFDKSADYDSDVPPALQYGGALATDASNTAPTSNLYSSIEAKAKQGWEKIKGTSGLLHRNLRVIC
jgi:hypothetical protein